MQGVSWENTYMYKPVSTIPDRRQGVLLLLIRRSLLGNEDEATGKSKLSDSWWINSQNITNIWGEMSQDELYSTTMDPANRHLVQLTTDDMSATLDLYNKLLGKQPSLRKEFILKNKLSKLENEDTYDDYEEEE